MGDSYESLPCFSSNLPVGMQVFNSDSVQHGLAPFDWKPMPVIGAGVQEIRINKGGAYRVIYIAKYEEAVYVLHAFNKKTQRTSKRDLELAKRRLRDVQRMRSER